MPLRFSALTTRLGVSAATSFSIAIHIHHRVRRNVLGIVRRENFHSGRRVNIGQLRRGDLKPILDRRALGRDQSRIDRERRRPVRKLSCQIFGGITVMPPPAWTCSLLAASATSACTRGSSHSRLVL